jgi:hypothetical protein
MWRFSREASLNYLTPFSVDLDLNVCVGSVALEIGRRALDSATKQGIDLQCAHGVVRLATRFESVDSPDGSLDEFIISHHGVTI